MEPRIATLLDQQPYRRLTLDPSVLTTPASVGPRYIELSSGASAGHSSPEPHGHHDHVDARHKTSSQAHSGAPLARVLNDPLSSSPVFQASSGRQTSQHAAFRPRSDVPVSGPSAGSPDAPRRGEQPSSVGYAGADVSLIQLPKPPQAPRRPAKRPRIPPLLQGLHQPPPLPPKNKLFPPISERSGLGSEVGDRFSLTSAFPSSGTEELAKAPASPEKRSEPASVDVGQPESTCDAPIAPLDQETSNGNISDPSLATLTASRRQTKVKTARKRTKWTQKETEDLLIGVSRFGIGRWKQILESADLHFQGRTAVDLKDRFRVCRPGEGLKARKGAVPEKARAASSTDTTQASSEATRPAAEKAPMQRGTSAQQASMEDEGTNDQASTKRAGVYGPFMKSQRRARREFSGEDDKNLLKGFKRHGAVWHAMRDDVELGFGMRHATDLRDRFRIRYPERFAKAGYKLKPKEARALREAEELKAQKDQTWRPPSPSVTSTAPVPASTAPKPAATRPTFELTTDFTFDDDDGGDRSPIVLNRNILQWADEHSSNPATSAAQALHTATHPAAEPLYNPFGGASDGLHINPLATLKLPCAHWSRAMTNASLPPPTRTQPAMRTPNLPNIVFPYVPSASARNTVHNLPAPADILSERQAGAGEGHVWIGQ
ncbi:uncharacterized protein M421DRAFT_116538 [Didymella exigua CBS 183.55]|uniref:Myb-like domain-containing protein n=1 Tax=Didymella exigua CBS 183.55 TaxID=1150837 RepID=A0A6A5S2U1_9PLEO|nr:uncharacterized protein M421DRAFT_116538 [Didymella exigua CBS 183.55]KAF1934233.1 hypothetical protein M421DRAFT_116538 [Didymella exigua CBS 183.55]